MFSKLFNKDKVPKEHAIRVYEVLSTDLKKAILEIMDEDAGRYSFMSNDAYQTEFTKLTDAIEGFKNKYPQYHNDLKSQFSEISNMLNEKGQQHKDDRRKTATEKLNELMGWTAPAMISTGDGGVMGFSGPEIKLTGNKMYVLMPEPDYYQNHPESYGEGTDRVVKYARDWTPLQDMVKVDVPQNWRIFHPGYPRIRKDAYEKELKLQKNKLGL